jgi:outer membrane protein
MKRFVQFLASLAAAATCFSMAAHAQGKTGYIDLQKVFDGYWRTKQADIQIKGQFAELEKMGNGMLEDYKKENEEFKKLAEGANDPAIGNEERDKRRKDLEKKAGNIKEMEANLNNFRTTSQKTLMEQKMRIRESILREVRGVIEEKAKAAGYAMVMDLAGQTANQTQFIIYSTVAGGENDLTEAVAKQLDSTKPADAPKTDDKPKEEKK